MARATAAAKRIETKLMVVGSAVAANDNRMALSAQDRELAAIDAGWLQEHRRHLRGKSMRLTVKHVSEIVTEERVLAFTGRRVEVWRAEVSQPIELVQTFLLPLSR